MTPLLHQPRGATVGIVTSVGRTLDAFFPPIIESLSSIGFSVATASGEWSRGDNWTHLPSFSQRPQVATPLAVREVRRWASRTNLDIVMTSTATASAIVRLAGLGKPIVYFCHGLHWREAAGRDAAVWRLLEGRLLRRTISVVCLNHADEQWFRAHTDVPVTRLPYGVGLPLTDYPPSPVPVEPLNLLWVGEFSPRKRPDLALDVVAEVRDLIKRPVNLQMLGDGGLRASIQDRIQTLKPLGTTSADGRGPMYPAISKATALLHTAAWEGLPRVALEAAAVGRWTYGFDVKGVRDAPLVRTARDPDVRALARLIAGDYAVGQIREVPDVRRELSAQLAGDLVAGAVAKALVSQ
ncbi:glycosyltransferase [Geodermatophilus sp. SYSU D00766]